MKRDTPTGSIELDTNGMIKKESIQSYNIQSTEITYCSYITRLNLEKIT
ncbi:hypothetical protein KBB05_01410 [Patescibacteria group bacterium]|nr:hypothetical protein [Patescibacteria group bacterium]